MSKRIKVVVEMAKGQVVAVRATREDVEVLLVDYDKKGQTFDDQPCQITRHEADEDVDGVQAAVEATEPDEEEDS